MTQKEKLIKKILNNPKSVDFETLDAVLRSYGWKRRNHGSSHFTYCKNGIEEIITLAHPHKRKEVKEVYVKRVIMILRLGEEE